LFLFIPLVLGVWIAAFRIDQAVGLIDRLQLWADRKRATLGNSTGRSKSFWRKHQSQKQLTIFRTAARGTILGNRGGALHNSDREVVRRYKSRRWITCVLEFRGRRRIVMSPNRYTELFFLDEAVAFAAGHRPCAECRRQRYNAFRHAWQRVKQQDSYPFADDMDLELHPARIDREKKVTYEAAVSSLPDGCFVQIEGRGQALVSLGLRCESIYPSDYQPGARTICRTLRAVQELLH
jgi:hypothetical protein